MPAVPLWSVISTETPASFPVVLGDFGCDVTCQAGREKLVTRIPRTGLGTRGLKHASTGGLVFVFYA